MSFLDKVKNMVNVSEEEYYDDLDSGDYSSKDRDDDDDVPAPRSSRSFSRDRDRDRNDPNKVVNINTTAQLQVVLAKPESFEEAKAVADNLNEKRTVVLNLESANRDVARRLVDFLSGVNSRKAVFAMKKQSIDKCILIIPRCRMYNHTFWLVYHKQIIIFIYNIKRYVLGFNFKLYRL